MQANRPPRDITPARFFTDWLPREFASEFGAGKRAASDITVAVDLEGRRRRRSGSSTSRRHAQRPRARATPGPAPMVQLWQSVQDWRALAVGEDGANVDLAPPQASPLDVLFVDPASRQILSAVKGTVRFEVTGYNGRTWWMHVKFGTQPGKREPDATITVDAGDLRRDPGAQAGAARGLLQRQDLAARRHVAGDAAGDGDAAALHAEVAKRHLLQGADLREDVITVDAVAALRGRRRAHLATPGNARSAARAARRAARRCRGRG